MTLQQAHQLLDQVKDGKNVPTYLITLALILTGDINNYEKGEIDIKIQS